MPARRTTAQAVVKTIIALGREMNMPVTIEGVETPAQVDFLCNANADQVQGFYFGKPVPAAEVGVNVKEEVRELIATADNEPQQPEPIKASA